MRMDTYRRKQVMVFGVFDRLHQGHREFLSRVKKYGNELVVIVARDNFVESFKKKTPQWSQKKRLEEIQKIPDVDNVALADEIMGTYGVIKKYKPDVICVGHDQSVLEDDLKKRMASGEIRALPIIRLPRYTIEKNNHEN